jgi:hypothetical protein
MFTGEDDAPAEATAAVGMTLPTCAVPAIIGREVFTGTAFLAAEPAATA